ncbi:MAG: FRG domain-containing protein [Deltaproteobacteria bacterium]|nr:FRG domain-containing protein [Deltaproteobacteria bacterium]
MTEIIVHESFDVAEQLLAALSPLEDRWEGSQNEWFFRGHGDARWPLVPTSLRTNCPARFGFGASRCFGPLTTNQAQILAELELIKYLAHHLDDQGIHFPGEDLVPRYRSQRVQNWMLEWEKELFRFPVERQLPLFAIAQHNGIPTRLLDWSEDPLTAAYFAAVPRATEGERADGTELAIWSLRAHFLRTWEFMGNIEIEIVTPPWSANPNLCAQRGHFTIHRPILKRDSPPCASSLDELMTDYARQAERWAEQEGKPRVELPVMRCLKLPGEQSNRLLRLLRAHGVSAGSLYPGHRGAAAAVLERQLWED